MAECVIYIIITPFLVVDAVILNGLNLYPFDREVKKECGGNYEGKDKVLFLCLDILGLPFTPLACLCEATGCGKRISNAMQNVSKTDRCQFFDPFTPSCCLCLFCCTECFQSDGKGCGCNMDPDKVYDRRQGLHMYFGGALGLQSCGPPKPVSDPIPMDMTRNDIPGAIQALDSKIAALEARISRSP